MRLEGSTSTPPFTEPGVALLRFVEDDQLPMDHVLDCYAWLDRIRARHGLPDITLRFWTRGGGSFADVFTKDVPPETSPDNPGHLLGFAPESMPWTIVLDADLRGPVVRAVIAHEVRHCMAAAGLVDVPPGEEHAEADEFALHELEAA